MKRFFICFAALAAMVLMIGCGGSSKNNNQNENPDSGDTVTDDDGDSGDSDSADTDPSDSGHEDSDITPEQPDNGDTTPDNGDSMPDSDNGNSAPAPDNDADTGNSGNHENPKCTKGSFNCKGEILQKCEEDDWKDVKQCNSNETCNATEGNCIKASSSSDTIPECDSKTESPCIDPATGLIWSAESEPINWNDAITYCENLSDRGYVDWYLPTIDELKTIVKYCEKYEPGGACGVTNSCANTVSCPEYATECLCDAFFKDELEEGTCKLKFDGSWHLLWSSNRQCYDSNYCSNNDHYAWTLELVDLDWYELSSELIKNDHSYDGHPINARCVKATLPRKVNCENLPENAIWNTVSQITQTWNEEKKEWLPIKTGTYNETPSSTECRFICEEGAFWDGSTCVPICGQSSKRPCKDLTTGFFWSEITESKKRWSDSVQYCEDLTEGGFDDWHLPTIGKLRTLMQNKTNFSECGITDTCLSYTDCYTDACDESDENYYEIEYSKLGDEDTLWSSSEAQLSEYKWFVNFYSGTIYYLDPKGICYVRCVRNAE